MKKLSILAILMFALTASSCGKYLDKSPDFGLSDNEVFSKYKNFMSYFDTIYEGTFNLKCHYPLYWTGNINKLTFEGLTDISDMSRLQLSQPGKQGDNSLIFYTVGYDETRGAAKVVYTWKIIRVCNTAISKIDMMEDATEEDKNDILGQAYFVRAFCHLEIFRFYGAVPYIDKVLGANDEWDLPATEDHEYLNRCAKDFETAAEYFKKAGRTRRDPATGPGNLSDANQGRPNGVAAMAMRGRALLYDASPLANPNNDITRWEAAAAANYEAIRLALENGYYLLPIENYTQNFYGVKYNNEELWAYNNGSDWHYNNGWLSGVLSYFFTRNAYSSANCPTQNLVDKFETLKGYPLNTESEREAATAAGEYNEQNPYINRDPRFYTTIIYNQRELKGYGPAQLYINEDGSIPTGSMLEKRAGSTDGVSETFYYENKRTGTLSSKGDQRLVLTDPIIRLAELYLNYAECANEAYGPSGKSPEADITALQALQVIRDRAGLPAPLAMYTGSREELRPRIKNERNVELCFEGAHYYCDIRRWKDAPSIGRSKLYGMRCTKLNAPYDNVKYPTGFRYERFELPSNRQIAWKDGMYWMQFMPADIRKMKNYIPKQEW